jgi:hypothetical protein
LFNFPYKHHVLLLGLFLASGIGHYALRQWVEHAIPPYRVLGNSYIENQMKEGKQERKKETNKHKQTNKQINKQRRKEKRKKERRKIDR